MNINFLNLLKKTGLYSIFSRCMEEFYKNPTLQISHYEFNRYFNCVLDGLYNSTNRIQYLTEHLKHHKKDFSSRRGLLKLVGRRRHLLDFLKKQDESKYKNILEKLKIRR